MAKRTCCAAVAIYSDHDDAEPIVAVGYSKEACENALAWKVAVHCQGDEHGSEPWVTYPAVEQTYED
jgi:hypothetical protein